MRRFYFDFTVSPPICLPAELDRERLVDITQVQQSWRMYVDPETGKTHSGTHHFYEFQTLRLGVILKYRKPEDGAEAVMKDGSTPPPGYGQLRARPENT